MKFICDHCGKEGDKPNWHVNRARKNGTKLHCSRACFCFNRRVNRTEEQAKQLKADCDRERLAELSGKLKEKQSVYNASYEPIIYSEKVKKRFEKYVMPEPNTGCWIWNGPAGSCGYGGFGVGFTTKRAHRISFELHKGAIPDKLLVCHTCDNRWCVNPDHLFLGTHQVNLLDMHTKGRNNNPRGEKMWNSKLSTEDILKIRDLEKSGIRRKDIAEMFGICLFTIYLIVNYKTWAHV